MGELPVICFALTWIVFAGYTYAADLDLMGSVQLTHLLIFSIAFYLIFLLSVASICANQYPGDQSIFIRSDRIEQFRIPVLCPLSPAEYGA